MGTKTKKTMEMMLACIQKAKVLMDEQDMLHMDEGFQESVLMALRITFMDLQTLLEYDKDGFIERQYAGNPRMMDPAMAWRVETDMPDFDRTRKDFQRDLCVCIAQRALYDALNHISEIQHICYNTGCFDYEFFGNDYGL